MFQLLALRCVGSYETGFAIFQGSRDVWTPPQRVNLTLWRRFSRFLNCPGINPGRGHMLDSFKSTTSHYFMELASGGSGARDPQGRLIGPLIPPTITCVYLGKYPVYWNHSTNQITYAHNMGLGAVWALDGAPFIPDVDILWIRAVSAETRAFYLTPAQLKTYDLQAAALAFRKQWHEECKARYYQADPPPPQRTVYSPLGPAPWTGKPMRELTLPTPTQAPTPPEEPGVIPAVKTMRVTLDFSLKEFIPPEGFNLFITM